MTKLTKERLEELKRGDFSHNIDGMEHQVNGLLSHIAALDAEIAELKWEYQNACKFTTDFENQRDQLREENEKLRAALEKLIEDEKCDCGAYSDCLKHKLTALIGKEGE